MATLTPQARKRRRIFTGIDVVSLRDWSNWENVLRTLIQGFGLLVGLSWDKAFDVAEFGIVFGFENTLTKRPVISRIVLGLSLVAFVLPAWIWYVVPLAQMSEAEIEAIIDEEIMREEALQFCDEGMELDDMDGVSRGDASGPWRNVISVEFPTRELEALAEECGGWHK